MRDEFRKLALQTGVAFMILRERLEHDRLDYDYLTDEQVSQIRSAYAASVRSGRRWIPEGLEDKMLPRTVYLDAPWVEAFTIDSGYSEHLVVFDLDMMFTPTTATLGENVRALYAKAVPSGLGAYGES